MASMIEAHASIDIIGNDTRTLSPGSLYVALRGESFDGHAFAAGGGLTDERAAASLERLARALVEEAGRLL